MRVAWWLASFVALGCSSHSTGPSGNGKLPDLATPPGGDFGLGSSGTGDGGTSGNDLAMAALPHSLMRRGFVTVVNQPIGATPPAGSTNLNAGFYEYPNGPCTLTSVGPCEHIDCSSQSSYRELSAGKIALGGGSVAVSLVPDSLGTYHPVPVLSSMMMNWNAGDMVTVNVPGDAFGAFTVDARMPAPITLHAPLIAAPSAPMTIIPRDKDLAVSWSGGSEGVYVVISNNLPGVTSSLRCWFPAAGGSGTVPQAALASLPASFYTMNIYAANLHLLTVGDAFVYVAVGSHPATLDGSSGQVTLQ
jgi:hypothetical protein